jgi:hypothetical protein
MLRVRSTLNLQWAVPRNTEMEIPNEPGNRRDTTADVPVRRVLSWPYWYELYVTIVRSCHAETDGDGHATNRGLGPKARTFKACPVLCRKRGWHCGTPRSHRSRPDVNIVRTRAKAFAYRHKAGKSFRNSQEVLAVKGLLAAKLAVRAQTRQIPCKIPG